MKFLDLNGKFTGKDVTKYKLDINKESKSFQQQKLKNILCEIYPHFSKYEEFPCFGTKLKLDFYINDIRLAFEFDGKQHEEYSPFFHKNRANWVESLKRDHTKERWCEINKIVLVRIKSADLQKNKILSLVKEAFENDG